MADIGQKIQDIINNGIEFLEKGLGVTLQSMLIQLIATLLLFLAIRYLLWNKITVILEKRKAMIEESLKSKEDAELALVELRKESQAEVEAARKKADDIVEKAKKQAYEEAQAIVDQSKEEAKLQMQRANEQIKRERLEVEDALMGEVVDIASLLATQLIEKEIDSKKHSALINEFLEKVVKEKHA